MNRPVIIGTRGSALALAQVALVEQALRRVAPEVQTAVRKIVTSGDRKQDVTLARDSAAGLKGLFTREIEEQLLDGTIDLAVHSLKDLPGRLPHGLSVSAVLERADTADVLIAKAARSLDELPRGTTIATSSVRRARQLRWIRPDVRVEEIRGNVPTRIEKLRRVSHWHAIVLARAGLDRLGLDVPDLHVSPLPILPAIGQGAIALESRSGAREINALLARINHLPTFICIRAERELLRLLNGGCDLPVGVTTAFEGQSLRMRAMVFGADDVPPATAEAEGAAEAPEELARRLFSLLTVQIGFEVR
jgi:hydroxymethylbilane synthase